MASIEDNILTAIQAKGRGSIFFPSDFTSYGEVKAVGKSLERLTAKGDIVRLARGIYLYPEIDTVLGLGILMPSIEQIAETIARREGVSLYDKFAQWLNEYIEDADDAAALNDAMEKDDGTRYTSKQLREDLGL